MADFVKKQSRAIRDNGTYIFSDFSYGLYLLDTPRGIGEQLGSLALLGGRNVWAENGALTPQYGYMLRGKLPEGESVLATSKDDKSAATFFILSRSGNIFLYTAAQGLKKYKTVLDITILSDETLMARNNKNMVVYTGGEAFIFGSYYEDSEIVTISSNVPVLDYSKYFEFQIPIADIDYYWNGKEICVGDDNKMTITYIRAIKDTNQAIIRAVPDFGVERPVFGETTDLGEKTLLPVDLVYHPEDETIESKTIYPQLLEIAQNRLCIVDTSGYIYYSVIGVMDNFKEAEGAGYFGGFYNDNSVVLAIDDYLNGILITKQNGLYYLTINKANPVSSSGGLVSDSTIGISITKVAEIGQEYPDDHIIIREKVYAYDSHTQSLVLACSQNAFSAIVSGKAIITADYLNAQDLGITESRRFLTYNAEADCLVLYYGEGLNNGLVITQSGSLFPRQLDKQFVSFVGFNQVVMGITADNEIVQDLKKGTVILNITPIAEFEAIGLKDNRMICSSILEVTELNGVGYDVICQNTGTSYQTIHPYTNYGVDNVELPPLVYSDKDRSIINNSFELSTKWAEKKSNLTRVYAPMSGRHGLAVSFEFPQNQAFCLAAIRLVDFSQGE